MALSAADLQKRLEGTPDPFPSLSTSTPAKSTSARIPTEALDTGSESAFPSLAPSPAPVSQTKNPAAVAPGWASRPKPVLAPTFSDSFILTEVVGKKERNGKVLTVSDIVKSIIIKHKVKIELSSQLKSNQTIFSIKGETQQAVDLAKKSLMTDISPEVVVKVEAPASVIGTIIGIKGATLKQIRDLYNVKIDIPPRNTLNAVNGSSEPGHATSPLAGTDGEEQEQTITISITGPAPLAQDAKTVIENIIEDKMAKTSQKVKDIPAHVFPFVLQRRGDFLRAAEGKDIQLVKEDKDYSITVSGDRKAVVKVLETIRSCMTFYESELNFLGLQLPKRQHHLLTGAAAEEIFAKTKCVVIVPSTGDSSDNVTVWGKPSDFGSGIQAVIDRANSAHTLSLPVAGANAAQILTYLHKTGYVATIGRTHPNVQVFLPTTVSGSTAIDFSGTKPDVDAAQKDVGGFLKLLEGSTKHVEIDPLLQKILQAKAGKQIKAFHGSKNVLVFFPTESESSPNVLLAYDPSNSGSAKNASEKQKIVAEVAKEISDVVKTLGDIKTEILTVETKWHDAIKGKNNSTINTIIGEGKALSIQVGPGEIITIRGAAADVSDAVKEIKKVAEEAKTDSLESGHSLEFSVSREYIPRIVGTGGSGIQKYRDQLDVKVDIDDAKEDSGEQVVGKRGKKTTGTASQSVIKVTGRLRNIEEAKKRILAQIEKMADETIELVRVPRQYHSGIIGQQGKYIQRIQEKYSVKITMPKEESAKQDEVTIKGGKKGVASAKAEILDLVEFEKENNNIVTFTVPARAVSRIMGVKGAKINEIGAETGANIDINREESSATITLRGTKKACAAAKTTILAIVDSVEEETVVVIKIEPKFHRTIIGGGGVGLKNLLSRVGASSDPKEQAGLVRFPQPPNDEVVIRGEKEIVKKVHAELERVVKTLRERVVVGVVIPNQHHRSLIGHGGQTLTELEKKTGAEVQFPGSRSYNQVAPPGNLDDLGDADEKDIVKVAGSQAACEHAIKELQASVAATPARPERKEFDRGQRTQATAKTAVPFKHYHIFQQNGNLLRDLRAIGVHATIHGTPTIINTPVDSSAPSGRIDDEPSAEDSAAQDLHGVEWKKVPYGVNVEAGDAEITLKGRDADSISIAERLVREALEKADKSTHTGFLTFPDRGVFPRIIGNKGSVINDLSIKSEADINVPRDNSTITIHGTETAVENARTEILGVAFGRRGGPGGGGGRRQYDRRQGRD